MKLLLFILSAVCIGIAVGLCSGELQSHIKFNSIESEIFLFLLCSVSGSIFLFYSVMKDEDRADRY